jgi:hypothetical protein
MHKEWKSDDAGMVTDSEVADVNNSNVSRITDPPDDSGDD